MAAWAGELRPGGVVVVEEPERIDTDDPDFRLYLELAAAVVADRGGDLYAGHELVDLTAPHGASIVLQRDAPLEVDGGRGGDDLRPQPRHLGTRPRAGRRDLAGRGHGAAGAAPGAAPPTAATE